MLPYQLIYNEFDNNVYQFTANEIIRFKLVQQDSQIKDDDVEKLFINNSNQNLTNKKLEKKLYYAIIDGQISIDQVLRFFFNNGN